MRSYYTGWFAVLVVPGLLAITGCKKTLEVTTKWADTPIKVDGRTGDWKDAPGILLAEQNASLTISNDEDFLYILFKTRDSRWVRTIKTSGLTLYLNSENKKKKDFFIRLKGGVPHDLIVAMDDRRKSFLPGGVNTPASDFRTPPEPSLTCYIKDRIIEKVIPLDGSEGPGAAFDTSQSFFTYEFSIPLTEGKVRYYGIDAAPGQQITIGAEWGGMEKGMRPSMRGMGMPGGSRPEPPGTGYPGGMGGRGMGGPPGNARPRPEMPEKQEVWIKKALTPEERSSPLKEKLTSVPLILKKRTGC